MISMTQWSAMEFSGSVPDVTISFGSTRVRVTLMVGEKTVYSETLYPIGGEVLLANLYEVLNPAMESRLVDTVTLDVAEESVITSANGAMSVEEVATSSMSCRMVYLNGRSSADCGEWCGRNFLSLLQGTQTSAEGRLEYLHYIGVETAVAMATYTDGTSRSFTPPSVGGGVLYRTIDVSPSQFAAEGKELSMVVVTAGARTRQYMIDRTQPDCAPTLLFTNCFGCQELLYCTGTHQVAPEYKRSSAYIGGLMTDYDIEETRTFKADTGVLTQDMARWADDLFRSKDIRIVNFEGGQPVVGPRIVVTDSKSEHSNAPDSLPRFTFSYRYATEQQNYIDMGRAGKIFDNTFDYTFN